MNRKLTLLFSLLLLSVFSFAQTKIKLDEVKDHIGDSITICGKVYSARFMENSKNTPTFLNIGAAFPNQLLTVVIWGDVRNKMENKPEVYFNNKEVCITGKIELYKEKPQIIIKNSGQIVCTNCN